MIGGGETGEENGARAAWKTPSIRVGDTRRSARGLSHRSEMHGYCPGVSSNRSVSTAGVILISRDHAASDR